MQPSTVGQIEQKTQNRVVKLFRDELDYTYIGNWEDRPNNSDIEEELLTSYLSKKGYNIIYYFMLFDGGVKKLPRAHQYFWIKEAQKHIRRREGWIIWHTQGSGKSIVMVLLSKWLLENDPNAIVAIITDRDELDKQIERVFNDSGEPIKRTTLWKR